MKKTGNRGKPRWPVSRDEEMEDYLYYEMHNLMLDNRDLFGIDAKTGKAKCQAALISCPYQDAKAKGEFVQKANIKFKGFRLVKQVWSQCPFDQDLELVDLKVDGAGPKEDQMYACFPELLKSIRRGNTFLKYNCKMELIRKGLTKFFDLRLAYVSRPSRQSLSTKDFAPEKHVEKAAMLGPVLRAITQGQPVEVF